MTGHHNPITELQIWEVDRVPVRLRRHISGVKAGGWVVYISPGGAEEIVQVLIRQWLSSGFSIEQYKFGGGGIVVTGSPLHS